MKTKKKFNPRNFGWRMMALPFVLGLMVIHFIRLVFIVLFKLLKVTFHYICFGGEFITFNRDERVNVVDLYEMLKKLQAADKIHLVNWQQNVDKKQPDSSGWIEPNADTIEWNKIRDEH